MPFKVSAPGKAILMGEHAAVYGEPALVAAVDRPMELELAIGERPGIHLVLPQVGVDEYRPWAAIAAYARDRREAWERWADAPGNLPFESVLGTDPGHLAWCALGETLLDLDAPPSRGIAIRMHSQIPLGSGFGSSAAASTVAVRALLAAAEADAPAERVYRLSLEAERRQHGSPSGVDNATVLNGGILWAEQRDGRLVTERVEVGNRRLLDRLRIYPSGRPAESTGEVVAAVRSRRDRDPTGFVRRLGEASRQTAELRRLLEQRSCDDDAILGLIRGFGGWLEEIGAVPPRIRDLFRRVEAAGGAAKISGAGSLSDPGAGSLLIFHPDPNALDILLAEEGLERLDVRFGTPGLRVEPIYKESQ